jgi:CRISPR-associated protein Cas2
MRRHILVCYDIADPKRLTRVAKTVEDFGTRVQFSVFLCELADIDLVKLRERLRIKIHHDEDRVLFIDLGPLHRSGQLPESVETLGRKPELPDTRNLIL